MHFLGDKMILKEKGYQLICEKYPFWFLFLQWRIFDMWCLHIPVADRTPFTGTLFSSNSLYYFVLKLNSLHYFFFFPYFCKMVESMLVVFKMRLHVSSYVCRNSFTDLIRHNLLLCILSSCRNCENSWENS